MEMNETRKFLINIIRLGKERTEIETEILSQQANLKKLNLDLEFAQDEYDKLESSGIRKFFLGLTGKLETRLQDAQNEIRKLQGTISNAEFIISSNQHRIENIDNELQNTKEQEEECVSVLRKMENGDFLRQSFAVVRELPVLNQRIAESCKRLSAELSRAEEIYTYGDIHYDLTGHKYDKKDSTLRNHTYTIRDVVDELVGFLDAYNSLTPEEIQIEFREAWMDDKEYWNGQQIAEGSYTRVKKVDTWFSAFSYQWKKKKTQRESVLEQLRTELLDSLSA